MKRLILMLCCLCLCLGATEAMAANSIVVESRNFNVSQALCSIGVFVGNDVAITGMTLPLEVRSVTGNAYVASSPGSATLLTSTFFSAQVGRRVNKSPLGAAYDNSVDTVWPGANITNSRFDTISTVNTCSGPESHSWPGSITNVTPSSPDAIFYAPVSTGDPNAGELISMGPGTDPNRRDSASFVFRFAVNANEGCFVIDTACRTPANHLVYVDENTQAVLPDFTKGEITVGAGTCGVVVNLPPNAICQNIQVGANASCTGSANAAMVNNGSSDPEDGTNLSMVLDPPGPYPLGPNNVNLIVTDTQAKSDTCAAVITVSDTTNPVVTCHNDTTVSNTAGTCGRVVNYTASATDNCDQSVTLAFTPPSGTTFNKGTTQVRIIATDDAGSADTCFFNVTVNDTQNPVIVCPSPVVMQCGAAPAALDSAGFLGAGGTLSDNCPGYTFSYQGRQNNGQTCPNVLTDTYRITDASGNFAECTRTITTDDTQSPVISTCQNDTTVIVPAGTPNAIVNYNAPVASDNCDQSLTVSCIPASGSTFPVGATPVRCIVTDDCGNADTCNFTVTVQEAAADVPPVAQCQNLNLFADGNCQANGSVNNGSFDPDGGAVSLSQTPAGPYGLGPTIVTLIVTDDELDADTCTATITVTDTTNPVITCPSDIVTTTAPDLCAANVQFSATGTDNCDQALAFAYLPASGSSFQKGTTQVRAIATDDGGNADTCFFNVTVNDEQDPTITCPINIKDIADEGQSSKVVNYPTPPASDNCPGAVVSCVPPSGSSFPIGQTTVTCMVTDAEDNTAECQFTVTINPPAGREPGPYADGPGSDTLKAKATCNVNPESQQVAVTYDDPVGSPLSVGLSLQENISWLSTQTDGSFRPSFFDVFFDVTGLLPGTYQGTIYLCPLFDVKGDNCTDSVIVILTVNPPFPIIDVDADTLCFNYTGFDVDTLCRYLDITNLSCGEACWAVFENYPKWISVNPISGTTPSKTQICVSPCELDEGSYYHTLIFCPCAAKEANQVAVPGCDFVVIKLNVINPPTLSVEPKTVKFDLTLGDVHLPAEVDVRNSGGGSFDWFAVWGESWLQVNPSSGSVPPDDVIYLSIDWNYVTLAGPDCDTLYDTLIVYADECVLGDPDTVLVQLCVCPPKGPDCDSICGVVLNSDCVVKSNCAVEGACVEAWTSYPDGVRVYVDTTDEFGAYCLDVDPGVEYDIRVYAKGYCTDVIEDVVCEDGDLILYLDPFDFVLPESPYFSDWWSTNATSNGFPIQPGDVIYACDSNGQIIGLAYVTVPGEYLIHVLGNVPKIPDLVDEGAEPGEKISLWLNCVCPVMPPQGWQNFGNYEYDAAWDCRPTGICCELCPGWNMFSYNILLPNYDREVVLATIDLNYDAVRSGRCDPTGPNYVISWFDGRPVNDLEEVTPWYGYDIHMTDFDTLCIEGEVIPADAEIILCEGWNYIPYFPLEATSRTHALQSIAGNYTNIFNLWCGQFESFNASRPAELNDLYCLEPCKGYWIKMLSDDILTYPTDNYECDPVAKIAANSTTGRVKGSPLFADFWSTTDAATSGLREGDIISVRTESGILAGEGTVGRNGSFLVHVFGDVPQTQDIEGAFHHESLIFEVNGVAASVEGRTTWGDREDNQITVHASGTTPVPTDYALLQNYPNPFNAGTVIPFYLKTASEWTLTVYNIMGQAVETFSGFDAAGTVRVSWNGIDGNGSSVPSGVYFYRVTTPEWTSTRKMTLLK